jgi:hypothetical protein
MIAAAAIIVTIKTYKCRKFMIEKSKPLTKINNNNNIHSKIINKKTHT